MKNLLQIIIIFAMTLITANCMATSESHIDAKSSLDQDKAERDLFVMPTGALQDKIKGGWAGQVIGCTFGGDSEFAYKGSFIPDYQPIDWWSGKIKYSFHSRPELYDDIYMDLAFLKVLAEHGTNASARLLAETFANAGFPLWHANQAARYNILHGLYPPESGYWTNNPHADDIDFQIEADFIGLISPGMLQTVAGIGDRVGHIMNYGDGWYGGIYVASMVSLAFVEKDLGVIVSRALQTIPSESDFYHCIKDVINWHALYPNDWKTTWFEVQKKWAQDYGCPSGVFHPFNIDAKINAAYVVIGLLYGNGDFLKTMEIATRCGQDADCNAATAGGVLGTLSGYSNLPADYIKDLAEIENQNFAHIKMSLDEAYRLTYDLALLLISDNNGRTGQNQVAIRLQAPKPVRFEKGWIGHHPQARMWLNRSLDARTSIPFNGNGIAVTGYVNKKADQSPDTVLRIKAAIDDQQPEVIDLPTDERERRIDLFWKYNLSPKEHVLTLELQNPDDRFEIRVREAVIYGPRPYSVE